MFSCFACDTWSCSRSPSHHPKQGDVDTALDFDEFLEALLRIALSAWQHDESVPAPWQKMRKVAALVAGELEAEAVKLDFKRLDELMTAETAKLNEMRVELIYNQFTPDSMRREEMREIKKKCEDSPKKQDEINFKTALSILEAEGNEEAARARAARGKFKKAGRLIGRVLG